MQKLSYLLTVVGLLVVAYAVAGRFIGSPRVYYFGLGLETAAGSILTVANTILLLAVLSNLYAKK